MNPTLELLGLGGAAVDLPRDVPPLDQAWWELVCDESRKPYMEALARRVAEDRARSVVYPDPPLVLRALRDVPLASVRGLLIGQDPYHGLDPRSGLPQARGRAFSVDPGMRCPPSLQRALEVLARDLRERAEGAWDGASDRCADPHGGYTHPLAHYLPHVRPVTPGARPGNRDLPVVCGDLSPWAERGVLLLNRWLTVRAADPESHSGWGWDHFTSRVVQEVLLRAQRPVALLVWGAKARALLQRALTALSGSLRAGRGLNEPGWARVPGGHEHPLLAGPHPSPLAGDLFMQSRHFSAADRALVEAGAEPIGWDLRRPGAACPCAVCGGAASHAAPTRAGEVRQ